MKNFGINTNELAMELALRTARGWTADLTNLRAEYGFSRATAYRWMKKLRRVQEKLRLAPAGLVARME